MEPEWYDPKTKDRMFNLGLAIEALLDGCTHLTEAQKANTLLNNVGCMLAKSATEEKDLRECLVGMSSVIEESFKRTRAILFDRARLSAEMLSLSKFHNALRILRGIDLAELEAAGLRLPDHIWVQFRDDPYRFFIRADDETAQKIWSIIEQRSKRWPISLE